MNLISNAIEAMPGGGEVNIRAARNGLRRGGAGGRYRARYSGVGAIAVVSAVCYSESEWPRSGPRAVAPDGARPRRRSVGGRDGSKGRAFPCAPSVPGGLNEVEGNGTLKKRVRVADFEGYAPVSRRFPTPATRCKSAWMVTRRGHWLRRNCRFWFSAPRRRSAQGQSPSADRIGARMCSSRYTRCNLLAFSLRHFMIRVTGLFSGRRG